MRIGSQTVGDHRKHGRIHALDFERTSGRQVWENFVHLRLALEHGRDHVFAPIEIDRDLGAAAAGCRSYAADAGNCAHRFLDWRRYFNRHPFGRPVAGIERDADARETDLWKKRNRERKARDRTGDCKRAEQKQNRTRMAVRPRTEAHFLISTAIPSSSS